MQSKIKNWLDSGAPFVWLNAGAVSVSVVMVVGLIALIAVRGLGHFWPSDIAVFDYAFAPDSESSQLMGEFIDEETVLRARAGNPAYAGATIKRHLLKTGNRDISGLDFSWILDAGIKHKTYPDDAMVVERREWGNFYGFLNSVQLDGHNLQNNATLWATLEQAITQNNAVFDEIRYIEKNLIGGINYKMEKLRLKERELVLKEENTPVNLQALIAQREALQLAYNSHTATLETLYATLNSASLTATTADGQAVSIALSKVIRVYRPNAMSLPDKVLFYFEKFWEFLTDDPREANTEGGIFPAIFGTVLMVIIMAVIVTPFGVIAAVYLREYATQNLITRLIRIAVNNLAGVPSVVYGVFGLGFFVYFLGGSIDQLFFPESLPAPKFGTPGLLWASLTLAILTVPVVIVATEEGLSRVPRAIREGSLALGATKAETLWRTVLPMTTPAMITGLILAVARAAGEVAPLMLVGVVKLAPSLGVDGNAPFLHLDRKFMHLGFHIYDVGFQSPNVEAAQPLVYATALLLVVLIIILNLTAIRIRNSLREKYRAAEQT